MYARRQRAGPFFNPLRDYVVAYLCGPAQSAEQEEELNMPENWQAVLIALINRAADVAIEVLHYLGRTAR